MKQKLLKPNISNDATLKRLNNSGLGQQGAIEFFEATRIGGAEKLLAAKRAAPEKVSRLLRNGFTWSEATESAMG
ncbi:Uncharacterised protein [Candidatus Gugararchaeum adminiculabundum]|nr:Uncharacterised protein [Candidatus Gugararchaeum adminiculabundum]